MAVGNNYEREWLARIALNNVLHGSLARLHLLARKYQTALAVFEQTDEELLKIIPPKALSELRNENVKKAAYKEYEELKKLNIDLLAPHSEDYPPLLLECNDYPFLLYKKGNCNVSQERIISIVGTRKASEYGKKVTQHLIKELTAYSPIIVSGLAYGIDIIAHQQALESGLETIAVLGNHLGEIYPSEHRHIAEDIIKQGMLLSEIPLWKKTEPFYFPMRNRVIAGISIATIIIESDIKGGSMITAALACSYNRELMAFPHVIFERNGKGPHHLIKEQMAHLIESADDVAKILGWEKRMNGQGKNYELLTLNEELLSVPEKKIIQLLKEKKIVHVDEINHHLKDNAETPALYLLQLEMTRMIQMLPGNFYRLK